MELPVVHKHYGDNENNDEYSNHLKIYYDKDDN